MGLEKVHRIMMDVFPQIDTRILRTIAIEHSKDVGAACLAVLTDIVPFTTLRSTPGSPLSQSLYEPQSSQFEGSVLPIHNLENSMQAKTETRSNGEDVELFKKVYILDEDEDDLAYTLGIDGEPSSLNGSMSQSSQISNMVAFTEQDAEQAKINDKAVDYIMVDLEVLKQTLLEANKSNNMHAGEVYPEKAMLATELEELRSRLICLANERDASFVDLNEMRQALEIRLAAAENVIKSAEQEKLEKRKAKLKAVFEHELMKRKVAQESKILKQQAEENAKLREFLMDRGRVVDILQREIAGICNDVKLLKESFDDNVSFSKSISSSQTSCILASSSKNLDREELAMPGGALPLVMIEPEDDTSFCSEGKSTSGDIRKELVDDEWVTEPEKDVISCFDQQSLTGDYRKELVDDGWEFCDDGDVLA